MEKRLTAVADPSMKRIKYPATIFTSLSDTKSVSTIPESRYKDIITSLKSSSLF